MDDRDIFAGLDVEGLTPVGQIPAGPYGQLSRPGQAPSDESFLRTLQESDIGALEPVSPRPAAPSAPAAAQQRVQQAAQSEVGRALTPKFIGERLAQRVLPSEVEPEETKELRRGLERKAAEIRLGGESPQAQALAAASGLSSAMMGIPAAGGALAIKGLGAAGVPGYERQAKMPFRELYEDIKEQGRAAETLYPKTGLAGTAAGLGASMATMPAILPRAGAVTSGGLTGATYGTIGGAIETGDPLEALKTGAISGLFGAVAAPVLERTISGFDRMQREGRALVSGGNLSPEAIRLARQAGMSPEDIRAIAPYMVQTQRTYGATPEAVRAAQFQEFGIPPTRGMISQDPATLAREAKYATPSYGAIGEAAEQAPGVVAAASARGAGAPPITGPGAGPKDLQTAITDAATVAQNLAQQSKQAYEAQYARAGARGGMFDPKSLENFGTQIADRIVARGNRSVDGREVSLTTSPLVKETLSHLDDEVGKFAAPTPTGLKTMDVSLSGLERQRRGLQDYYDRGDPNEKRVILAIKKEFDDLIAQKLNSAAYSGDPRAIREWEAARHMFAGWQKKFGTKKTGEDAGTLLRDILNEKRSPDQVGNLMFNFNTADPKLYQTSTKTYMNLARALGPNAPELAAIRQAYVERLMQPMAAKSGQLMPKDFGKVADDINRLLNGNGRPFSRRVFSQEERDALGRYQKVMRLASQQSPEKVPGLLSQYATSLAGMGVNAVTVGVGTALGFKDPALAGVLAGGIAALKGAKDLTPLGQYPLARVKPGSTAETILFPSQYPATRVGTAAGLQALPNAEENLERAGRKHGGRISAETQADRLIRAAESAKKQVGKNTEAILNAPDEHVVKALKVANENLEG